MDAGRCSYQWGVDCPYVGGCSVLVLQRRGVGRCYWLGCASLSDENELVTDMSRSSSPQASQPGIQGALSPVVVATNSGPHVGIVLYEKDCGCDTDRRGLVRTRPRAGFAAPIRASVVPQGTSSFESGGVRVPALCRKCRQRTLCARFIRDRSGDDPKLRPNLRLLVSRRSSIPCHDGRTPSWRPWRSSCSSSTTSQVVCCRRLPRKWSSAADFAAHVDGAGERGLPHEFR